MVIIPLFVVYTCDALDSKLAKFIQGRILGSLSLEVATVPNMTFRIFNANTKKLLDFEFFLFLMLIESKMNSE